MTTLSESVTVVIDEEGDPWFFADPKVGLEFATQMWGDPTAAQMTHNCPIHDEVPEGFGVSVDDTSEEHAIAGSMLRTVLTNQIKQLDNGESLEVGDYTVVRNSERENDWTVWEDGEHWHHRSIDEVLNHILLDDMMNGGD
jgi:hypothetical protein